MSSSEASASESSNEHKDCDIENDAKKKGECINQLRALVTEEKRLKVRMDDLFMLRYLRAHDFDPKLAFEKMLKVYKFKAKHKAMFFSGPLSNAEERLSQKYATLLEDRDQHGRQIFYLKLGDIDIEKENVGESMSYNDIWLEMALDDEENQKNGIVIITDFGGLPMRMLRFLLSKNTITHALKEEMRPWKSLQIHVVNTSKFVPTLMNFVFPFLGAKFKENIHFHSPDWETLHKFIDPKVLPQEYGGQITEIDYDKMNKQLLDNADKLTELFSLEYDKS